MIINKELLNTGLTQLEKEEKIKVYKLKHNIKRGLSYAERISIINGNTFHSLHSKDKKRVSKKEKKRLKKEKVTKKTKRKLRKKDGFYDYREWRELRYKALKLYGRKCVCCGRMPPEVQLHVDHIKPRSKYPELELDIKNLQIMCKDCNLGKSNYDEIDYRTNDNYGN